MANDRPKIGPKFNPFLLPAVLLNFVAARPVVQPRLASKRAAERKDEAPAMPVARRGAIGAGRNQPCHCGSGKKSKKCCRIVLVPVSKSKQGEELQAAAALATAVATSHDAAAARSRGGTGDRATAVASAATEAAEATEKQEQGPRPQGPH